MQYTLLQKDHVLTVCWSEYKSPCLLNFRHYTQANGELDALKRFTLGKESLVSIRYDAGWTPEHVWMK